MPEHRQIIIRAMPEGALKASDFEIRSAPIPACGDGELLCRGLALTIGAGQRAGLQGSASYTGTPLAGSVMSGNAVARVEISRSPGIEPGDLVFAPTGWQECSTQPRGAVHVLPAGADPALHLGVLGTNGLTAYFGLLDIGEPRPGETVVVSAAAGSVGHVAGQIAKLLGCRVVGVAGSDAKCAMLVEELGFDAAVNYKDPNFRDAFKAATPDRIDVYFDNTGGDVLGSALFRMNLHGRIVCCGVVSQYDTSNPGPGPRGIPGLLVNNRVRMQGFLVFEFEDRYAEARAQLSVWLTSGAIRPKVTQFEGLESAPHAFTQLLAGATTGTTIVNLA